MTGRMLLCACTALALIAAPSFSANAANDSDVKNTEGVSQNAMEFLQRNGNANQPSQNQPSQNQVSSNNSSESDRNQEDQAQQESAQNALQYLTGDQQEANSDAQEQEQTQEQTEESAQNALQYLTGDQPQTNSDAQEQTQAQAPTVSNSVSTDGMISIEDLINVQGVGQSGSTETSKPDLEEPTEAAEKDG